MTTAPIRPCSPASRAFSVGQREPLLIHPSPAWACGGRGPLEDAAREAPALGTEAWQFEMMPACELRIKMGRAWKIRSCHTPPKKVRLKITPSLVNQMSLYF